MVEIEVYKAIIRGTDIGYIGLFLLSLDKFYLICLCLYIIA